jgi:hypothetical protein
MFVSFYTQSHEASAMRLKESLDRLDLKNDFSYINQGDDDDNADLANLDGLWNIACRRRSAFILRMMEKHGKIVWLDADTVVLKPPELLAQISNKYHVGMSMRPSGVIGGVIWAQPQSKFFWEAVMDLDLPDEDARTTQTVDRFRKEGVPLRIYPLPPAYQYVPWLMRLESALKPPDVYIVHEMRHSKTVQEDSWARWSQGL